MQIEEKRRQNKCQKKLQMNEKRVRAEEDAKNANREHGAKRMAAGSGGMRKRAFACFKMRLA
jgi:hypothetical protein